MRNKLIYIGGSIKSGTTLFSAVLGNNDSTINFGEYVNINKKIRENDFVFFDNQLVEIENVELWKKFRKDISNNFKNEDNIFYHYKFLSNNFNGKVIVDSSKSQLNWTLNRFNEIEKHDIFESYFIHLIRKPEAVVYSQTFKKYNNVSILILLKEYLKWCLTNILTKLKYGRKKNYLKIRYEEFCSDPIQSIDIITELTGIDFSSVIDKVKYEEPFYFGCSLDGNPFSMREKKISKITLNESYKKERNIKFRLVNLFFKPISHFIY